jgi:hypothetical protein
MRRGGVGFVGSVQITAHSPSLFLCSWWFSLIANWQRCSSPADFYFQDGGDTFLRNVGSSMTLKAPHPRREHSSEVRAVAPRLAYQSTDHRFPGSSDLCSVCQFTDILERWKWVVRFTVCQKCAPPGDFLVNMFRTLVSVNNAHKYFGCATRYLMVLDAESEQ